MAQMKRMHSSSCGTSSATTAGTVTTAAQPNMTSVGTLTSLSSSGNIVGANLISNNIVSAVGNITCGNLIAVANIYFSGSTVLTSGANVSIGTDIVGGFIRIGNTKPSVISIGGNTTSATIELGNTTSTINIPGVISNISVSGNITGNNLSATTAFQLPVYANTTVRDAVISSPAIGMLIVVGNIYQGYNGSSWGNIALT